MLAPLINYITERSVSPLSKEDIDLLNQAFIVKRLRKKQFLLQEGEICRFIGFIVRGAMRQYTVDARGGEHVLNLGIENWWISDRESYHKQTPSIYNIDAWEETDLLLLPKANDFYERVNSIAAFKEMRIILDDNNHIASQKRLLSSKNHTAEYRYGELRKVYPEFLTRFPQHLIASYLGVTKETLSRIRHQSLRG